MALITAGSFASNIDVLKVMSNDWYDVETNEVIPHEQIGQITKRLIEAGKLIDESQKETLHEIRSRGGDKGAVTRATEHIIPAGNTALFKVLSRKCLVKCEDCWAPSHLG